MFFIVFFSIYGAMHWFVYARLADGLKLAPRTAFYAKLFFYIAGFSFIFHIFIRKNFIVYPVGFFGEAWLGLMSISCFVFALKVPFDMLLPNRRKTLTIGALVVIFAVTSYSVYNASLLPRVRELALSYENLPDEGDGFVIVQLSDVHLSPFKSAGRLEKIVETVNGLNPDLVVITGDLIDGGARDVSKFLETISGLKAKHGVLAVPGNHEHYSGMENFKRFISDAGFTLVMDKTVTVAGFMNVVGLDDEGYGDGGNRGMLKTLMAKTDPEKFTLFLYHRPHYFEEAAELGVDLQLSGHTHVGQIPPMDIIVWFYFKYPYGLFQIGGSRLYTTSGTGEWGPPMRFLSRSEVVKIVLEKG